MIIEAKNIDISFITSQLNNVLNNVNFILKDKINIIKGESGSGKSTLLHIINLDLVPSSGELVIDGVSISNSTFNYAKHKKEVLMINELLFKDDFKVIDNIALNMNDNLDYNERLKTIKSNFGENSSLNNKLSTLSSGQKLLTALFLAKLRKAKLILLDEPTANLGEKETKRAIEYLIEISKSTQLVIATNDERLIIDCAKVFYVKNKSVFVNE